MKTKNAYLSGFLFSTPSFLTGAGTVINLAGNYYKYNTSPSTLEADLRAIRNDFWVIGDDIRAAIEDISREGNQSFSE